MKAAADNDILALMVFALAIGIGLVLVQNEKTEAFKHAVEGLLEITMALIDLVIRLAPIAVACFMFNLAALFEVDIVVRLGWYVATVLAAILLQLLVVYPIGVWLAGGMGPRQFFGGVPPAAIWIVLGVDRFLDMCRTMLNVTGDLAIATMVAGHDRNR